MAAGGREGDTEGVAVLVVGAQADMARVRAMQQGRIILLNMVAPRVEIKNRIITVCSPNYSVD
jgi:uncharacterized membrane protein AbrB (regulator of aidB expression)